MLCFRSLPGDLDSFRKNPFVLKEGVEYRIKINFKVSLVFVRTRIPGSVTAATLNSLCHLFSRMTHVVFHRSTKRLCQV